MAFCPTLRDCVAQGSTRKETIKNLKEAMADYFECLIEDSIPVPQEVGKEILELEVVAH